MLSHRCMALGEAAGWVHLMDHVLRGASADAVPTDCVRLGVQNLKQKHWSEKPREAMTTRDWRIFREDHRMSVKNAGPNAPLPFRNWDEMPLAPPLRKAIADNGYEMPSPIQMSSMPYGLRQRDVIGLAETGSGKTAAFVLPMLIYIMGQPEMTEAVAADGPYALVLAPTRELAQQIEEEITKLAKYTRTHPCHLAAISVNALVLRPRIRGHAVASIMYCFQQGCCMMWSIVTYQSCRTSSDVACLRNADHGHVLPGG